MTDDSLYLKICRFISNFFNPLVSLLIFFGYFSIRHYSFSAAVVHFLPVLLIIILPVIFWIIYNIKKGEYKDANVSERKKRTSLYIFIEVCIALYLIYRYLVEHETDVMIFFLLILLVAMHLSNYFLKSSMHVAFNVFAAALFFTENAWLGILWLFISAVVAFTRIVLKRHTLSEVLAGAGIAAVVSFVYLYLHIQLSH